MGCESVTDCIVATVQMPSFGVWQPIENSPPGIHTMPGGAFVGAGAGLGMVGANGEALVAGATTSAADAGALQPRTAAPTTSAIKNSRALTVRDKMTGTFVDMADCV